MIALPNIASGLLWKLGAGAAVIATIVIGFFLFTTTLENKNLTKQRDTLSLQITDPKTGYIARLTQANANVVVLQDAIKVQNEKYVQLSNESKASLAALTKRLAAAQAESRRANQRLAAFMAKKPQGNTLEDRVNDIDRRVLEDLNREK